MNSKEVLKLKGRLQIALNGKIVRDIDNLVVTVGKNWVASRMGGGASAVMSHMAIGTGTTAAAIGDTTVETEVARVALTAAGGTVSTNTIVYACTFAADVPDVTAPTTSPITEAGILNAASAGTLLAHTVFPVVNKGEADTMTISWTITIS